MNRLLAISVTVILEHVMNFGWQRHSGAISLSGWINVWLRAAIEVRTGVTAADNYYESASTPLEGWNSGV